MGGIIVNHFYLYLNNDVFHVAIYLVKYRVFLCSSMIFIVYSSNLLYSQNLSGFEKDIKFVFGVRI